MILTFVTSDQQTVHVKAGVMTRTCMNLRVLLTDMFTDVEAQWNTEERGTMYLPAIHSSVLAQVILFCQMCMRKFPPKITPPLTTERIEELNDSIYFEYAASLAQMGDSLAFYADVLMAAEYFGNEHLMTLLLAYLATVILDKTPNELVTFARQSRALTQQEMKTLAMHTRWTLPAQYSGPQIEDHDPPCDDVLAILTGRNLRLFQRVHVFFPVQTRVLEAWWPYRIWLTKNPAMIETFSRYGGCQARCSLCMIRHDECMNHPWTTRCGVTCVVLFAYWAVITIILTFCGIVYF